MLYFTDFFFALFELKAPENLPSNLTFLYPSCYKNNGLTLAETGVSAERPASQIDKNQLHVWVLFSQSINLQSEKLQTFRLSG